MIIFLLVAVLLAAAGHFKGRMDALVDLEIKQIEWHKKYDFTKPSTTKHWWYFGLYKPTFPEKFPFSTTALVFLTDKWHRAQFFMLKSFYLAISLCMSDSWITILLSVMVIMPIIVGVFFEASYDEAKRKALNKQDEDWPTEPSGAHEEPNDYSQVTSVPEKQIGD